MRVELEQVSKRFGKVPALRDVSLKLVSGSRTALIGPNGSGKSTLTRIVMGLVACSGEVRLDGCSPFQNRVALAKQLAYVPQIAPKLGATVSEIVAAVASLRRMDGAVIASAAARLGMELAPIHKQPFRNLSGGMRQKLLAAIALSCQPRLLVLDEPTASMDAPSRAIFFEMVEQLPERPTIILCSHRLIEIRHLVDNVAALEEGALVWQGPATEYLQQESSSIVELMVRGETASSWLSEQGFRRGGTGWWSQVIRSGNRRSMVQQLTDQLGSNLDDIVVRDVEDLELHRNGCREES